MYMYYFESLIIYSMYEIALPNPLPPTPARIEEYPDPVPLPKSKSNPILQFKRGEYPAGMCCVLSGSKFYFFGAKHDDFRVLESLDYVDEDVNIKYKDVKRDRFLPEILFLTPPPPSPPLPPLLLYSIRRFTCLEALAFMHPEPEETRTL